MREQIRGAACSALRAVELGYRRLHRLQPLGNVLLLGIARHRGEALALDDGTRVDRNATIGVLHFDNLAFAALPDSSAGRAARAFAREMLASMQALAQTARSDARFAEVQAFQGTTWLPPHGQRIGFVARPLSAGPATPLRAAWFHLLLWAFAPAAETRQRARPVPHAYWLSRRTLLERFPCRAST